MSNTFNFKGEARTPEEHEVADAIGALNMMQGDRS